MNTSEQLIIDLIVKKFGCSFHDAIEIISQMAMNRLLNN